MFVYLHNKPEGISDIFSSLDKALECIKYTNRRVYTKEGYIEVAEENFAAIKKLINKQQLVILLDENNRKTFLSKEFVM